MRSLSRLIEQDAARRAMPVVTVTTKPVLHGRASADGYVQTVLATCQSQQAGDDIAKISPEMTTISSSKATQLSRTHEEMKEDLMLRRSL